MRAADGTASRHMVVAQRSETFLRNSELNGIPLQYSPDDKEVCSVYVDGQVYKEFH